MPRSLAFNDIRSLAANPERRVMLLAQTGEKAAAVLCSLRARLANVLVADETLAKSLLNVGS
jgi:DNA-binding transcriptional regulator LsrR (DeoR family)